MVVSALVQLAIAGPVGFLFGISYGTAIRIGYEQVYPALFGNKPLAGTTEQTMSKLEGIYTKIGGLEANAFGINQGVINALKAIEADPELTELIKKNSNIDSQTITVNLSGGSQAQTSVSSPSSPSSGVDTTGGRADRLGKLKLDLETAKANNNKIVASAIYREALLIMQYIPTQNQLEQLFSKGSFEHFSLIWNLALMDTTLVQQFFTALQNYQTQGRHVTAGSSQASKARAAADIARQRAIKDFGDTTVNLTTQQRILLDRQKTLGVLPRAGQTQKIERDRLIKLIAFLGRVWKDQRNKAPSGSQWKQTQASMLKRQAELTALLKRYRF